MNANISNTWAILVLKELLKKMQICPLCFQIYTLCFQKALVTNDRRFDNIVVTGGSKKSYWSFVFGELTTE